MAQDKLYEVRVERNLLIPLSDGVSLAADLYLPNEKGSFPTLVNYYPYHKDDLIGSLSEHSRRYFAERGYANLLVDFRGLGSSDGVAWGAMDSREDKDGAEIIEWAARQPWCDGNVGVWGISYGGITSLKIAAQNPPHLKAIVPIYASLDIYYDFIYPGGCLNCLGAYGAWGSFMLAMNLMPPTYLDAEGRWYRIWQERLEKGEPYIFPWQDHPAHDEYWQSRAVPVDKIQVPTFVIGGWRDIFPELMPRLYEQLSVPKKFLMGPWMHNPPDISPFEQVDYLYEMKRWWDHWLKGEKNGIMDEPPVTVFVQGSQTWKHEQEWPIARTEERTLFLSAEETLTNGTPREEGSDTYQAIPIVGVTAGLWDPTGLGVGLPLDQGPDDLRSLTYTTDPLLEEVEISGSPEAILYAALESGEEVNLVAKLNVVGPDGSSSLITTGWLKGDHHRSHERPEPLQSGKVYEFRIPLWATSYLVPQGHRLRLSVSCSDFPRIWPTRTNPEIRLFWGGTHLSSVCLSAVPPSAAPVSGPPIRRPEPGINRTPLLVDSAPRWKVERDLATGTLAITTGSKQHMTLPNGGIFQMDHSAKAGVTISRPDGAKVEGETTIRLDLPAAGIVQVETKSWISQTGMLLTGRVTVDGRVFFEKQWQK
jgi:putative CocE/NonD family hydrolase